MCPESNSVGTYDLTRRAVAMVECHSQVRVRVREWQPRDETSVLALYRATHDAHGLSSLKPVRKFIKRALSKKDLGDVQR